MFPDPLDETECSPSPVQAVEAVSKDIEGLRVGILAEGLSEDNAPDINDGILASADALKAAGALVEKVSIGSLHQALATYYILAPAEASSNLSRFDGIRYGPRQAHTDLDSLYTQNRTLGFGQEVKRRILMGTYCLSAGYYDAYYRKALLHQASLRDKLSKIFGSFDLILLPTAPDIAPKIGASTDPMKMKLSDIYTVLANLTGVPAISVPCGLSRGCRWGPTHGPSLARRPVDLRGGTWKRPSGDFGPTD